MLFAFAVIKNFINQNITEPTETAIEKGGTTMEWLYAAIGFVAGGIILGIIAWKLGFNYRKKSAEQQLGYAEDEAKRIINEALKTAESKKKEAVIEAKEEIIKNRNEADRELRERRSEVQRQENASSRRKSPLTRK